jgi:hypothetical protein
MLFFVSVLNENFAIVKNDEGERCKHRKTHFGAHFSQGWRGLRGSRKDARPAIREGIAALITHKVLQLSNNKKSGLLASQGSWPAPTILSILPGDLGAGAAPASLQLQLTAIGNRRGFRCSMSESDATVK